MLRGLGQTLITAGVVLLLFVVYEVWVSNIFAAATNIMAPFPTTTLKMRLTSVTANASNVPKVDWS